MATLDRRGAFVYDAAIKTPVLVATTAAITLAGAQTIDGVAVGNGERVLVKDQAGSLTNGIYAASSGNWTRTTDANNNSDFVQGTIVPVASGTVNAGGLFEVIATASPIVLGSTALTFALQSTVANSAVSATSTSSLAIAVASKSFATQAGKNFVVNQWVLAYSSANHNNNMYGQITSYTGGTLVVNVIAVSGSGTLADWNIVLANSPASQGIQPPVGTGNVTGPGSSVAGHLATFADTSGHVLADGGAAGALANLSAVDAAHVASSAVATGSAMLNGTIVHTRSASAETIAIKTIAGNDPSAGDPVYFVFRDVSPLTGGIVVRQVTAALSITIPSTKGMNFTNGIAARFWELAIDNAGTVELAVINCVNGKNAYALSGFGIITTLAVSGATSAHVAYSTTARTSLAYAVLGNSTWENGLAASGTWDTAPSRIDPYRAGMALPGMPVQVAQNFTGAVATGTTVIPLDDTIPQITEGDQYMTQAIVPSSGANLLHVVHEGLYTASAVVFVTASFFRDSGTDSVGAMPTTASTAGQVWQITVEAVVLAAAAVSTTFKLRAGPSSAGTTTFNGAAGARKLGGVLASFVRLTEIMG